MFGLTEKEWKEKDGFNTAKEIYQQPELWLETVKIIEQNKSKIESFLERLKGKENTRIIFTGAGTSAYVGDVVVPYLNSQYDYSFEAIPTTDIISNPKDNLKKKVPTIMVSFARSGNSPESVATYELVEKLVDEVSHIIVTCNPDGELAKISEGNESILLLLMPEKSNDKGFAMTSSFSCMALTALLMFDMQNFEGNRKQIIQMIDIAKEILSCGHEKLQEILDCNFERVVYLGSGVFFGLSKESALKVLELTSGKIVSHKETILGFRHGPKSIVNDNTLIFMYISEDEYSRKYDMDLLVEIYNDSGNHKVISIVNEFTEEVENISDYNLVLSKKTNNIYNEVFISLLYVLYAQIFALLSSVKLGIAPDNPNPSGIVNRVVKGVTIHKFNNKSTKY